MPAHPVCLHALPPLLQLENQLAAAGQDRARWEERAAELQRELEAARTAARQEQERLEGRAAQLAGELEAARAAAAQVPPLQDRLAAAGEERRRLEARAAELEGQLGSVRAAAESEQARLGGELAALRTQLEQARAEASRVSPCLCGAETLAALFLEETELHVFAALLGSTPPACLLCLLCLPCLVCIQGSRPGMAGPHATRVPCAGVACVLRLAFG